MIPGRPGSTAGVTQAFQLTVMEGMLFMICDLEVR